MALVEPLNKGQSDSLSLNRILFKIHRKSRTEILAICDENLLGQELRNDRARMIISSDFYSGQEISAEEALRLMNTYTNINAVGSVLEYGIRNNLINEDAIIWFTNEQGKKIPHLLIFSLPPI